MAAKFTRDELEPYVMSLIERQLNVGFENYMVPLLIGPTQCGKTRWISQLAKKYDYGVVTLLLQTEDPTELTGLIKAIEIGDHFMVERLYPKWFNDFTEETKRHDKVIILLDEIDKAPTDCLSAILTLLRNKKINGFALEKACFVGACNPFVLRDEWVPELRARFRGIQLDYDWPWEIAHMPKHIQKILKKRLGYKPIPSPEDTHDASSKFAVPFPETPTTWWNLSKDLMTEAICSDEVLLKYSIESMFEKEKVAPYILSLIGKSNFSADVEPSFILNSEQRDQLAGLVLNRTLTPEVVAKLSSDALQFLYGQPLPEDPELEKKYQEAGLFALLHMPMACIQADIDVDGCKEVEYTGQFTSKILTDIDYKALSRVHLNPEQLAAFSTENRQTETGINTLARQYEVLSELYEKQQK